MKEILPFIFGYAISKEEEKEQAKLDWLKQSKIKKKKPVKKKLAKKRK